MVRVTSYPDDVTFEVGDDDTVLTAGLRRDVTFAHACGGRARCSTCRVWVREGLENCPARNGAEQAMADRLGLDDHVRLACQLRPTADLTVRRLVVDETDMILSSQLDREVATRTGEVADVTVFFSDIRDFTRLSARLPAYDVMYILNRYFVQAGDVVERNGGYIDKFIGDGMMAIFGSDGKPQAALRAVNAALQTLEAVDRMKGYFRDMYDVDFDIRIGLHHGPAVLGTLGSVGHERMTAIGEVVNIASRVETANKEAGTRLLITDAVLDEVEGKVRVADFIRTRLTGIEERITLHEVGGLTPEGAAALELPESRDTMFLAGRTWTRMFPADELAEGEHRVVPFPDRDIVFARKAGQWFAFNNACPHLNIPLYERRDDVSEAELVQVIIDGKPLARCSEITGDRGVVCRWHRSCFDLQTGEIREWVPSLNEGIAPGWEFIGDIGKNPARLQVFPCRVHDDHLWVALR